MSKRTCSVADCDRLHDSNGYCSMHSKRVRRTGTTEAGRRRAAPPRGVRVGPRACSTCKVVKVEDEFSDRPSRGPGAKNSQCRTCATARARNYQRANPDVVKSWASANREKTRAAGSRWRATPKGQETLRALEKRRDPARHAAKESRRRARKRGVTTERVELTELLRRHGRWCGICQRRIKKSEPVQIDHIVPLARGGEHTYANTQPAHRLCNQRKSAKLLDELPWVPPQLTMPLA